MSSSPGFGSRPASPAGRWRSSSARSRPVSDRAACARQLVSLAVEHKQQARATEAIDRLTRMGCGGPEECSENIVYAAMMEQQRGNVRRALAFYERAHERAPHHEHYLITVAALASQQGMHGKALDAYTKLAQRHPEDPQWAAAAVEQRAKVQSGLVREDDTPAPLPR
jgi:tetratricopeptide (TPR) repeat protein